MRATYLADFAGRRSSRRPGGLMLFPSPDSDDRVAGSVDR
jgi:hypothetical protein